MNRVLFCRLNVCFSDITEITFKGAHQKPSNPNEMQILKFLNMELHFFSKCKLKETYKDTKGRSSSLEGPQLHAKHSIFPITHSNSLCPKHSHTSLRPNPAVLKYTSPPCVCVSIVSGIVVLMAVNEAEK